MHALALAGVLAVLAVPQDAAEPDAKPPPPRTGYFTTKFAEGSPVGTIEEQRKRFGWPASLVARDDPERKGVIDWSGEEFVLYVPDGYTRETPHGVCVYISATPEAQLHPDWLPVLAKRRLIGVSFARGGNERHVWNRVSLALAAVHNVQATYAVDPRRIYISGYSGGGKVSCLLGLHYPDVFTGMFAMCGSSYFRAVPVAGEPGRVWTAEITKPRDAHWATARRAQRFVLFTGSDDVNRASILARAAQGLTRDGVRHVHVLDCPAWGHVWPNAEWFDKGLALLDAARDPAPESTRGGR